MAGAKQEKPALDKASPTPPRAEPRHPKAWVVLVLAIVSGIGVIVERTAWPSYDAGKEPRAVSEIQVMVLIPMLILTWSLPPFRLTLRNLLTAFASGFIATWAGLHWGLR